MLCYFLLYYIKIMLAPARLLPRGARVGGGERQRKRHRRRWEWEKRGRKAVRSGPDSWAILYYYIYMLYVIIFICYFTFQEAERRQWEWRKKDCAERGARRQAARPFLFWPLLFWPLLFCFCFSLFCFDRFCFASVLAASVLTGSPSLIGPEARVRVELGELLLCNWL